jgi:hypothetical protein
LIGDDLHLKNVHVHAAKAVAYFTSLKRWLLDIFSNPSNVKWDENGKRHAKNGKVAVINVQEQSISNFMFKSMSFRMG